MRQQPSANFDERPPQTPIDMLVLHYTGMENCKVALDRLCDPAAKVSAHYLIDKDGTLYQLVHEKDRAWHAGVAFWRGQRDINARSIGIELVNPGHEFGLRAFPEAQMLALEKLALEIIARHKIPARNVVGHGDVAPRRKSDPGELFDWQRLSKSGLGCWPEPCSPVEMHRQRGQDLLAAYGYETVELDKTIEAFQRHFRSSDINGEIDHETAGILDRLSADVR